MYKRKTKDVYKLWWNGEYIDSFDTKLEAKRMAIEYKMAYRGTVIVKKGREKL